MCCCPLNEGAAKTKPVPEEYIADDGFMVNERFGEYIDPLVGGLPDYVRLGFSPL